jgi:mono/diheme cytochrome c family protein
VAVKEPEPVSPLVQAALARKRIPYWVAPVLLFLPIWVIMYPGTLERPPAAGGGILGEGQTVYNAKCASCHGSTGGGGVGRQLNNKEVLLTFPQASDHVWWVINGSASAVGVGNPYGDPNRPGGQHIAAGGMASWAAALTAKELLSVVYYERVKIAGATEEEAKPIKDLAESTTLPAHFTEGMTQDQVAALFAAVESAAGGTAAK